MVTPKTLHPTNSKSSLTPMANQFLNSIMRRNALTENGAISNSTTGSFVLDYFAKSGAFRNRTPTEVNGDLQEMWKESPELTLKVIFYNRIITRQVKGFKETDLVQKGQGNRSEFRAAIGWLAKNQPDALYRNLHLIPLVGTWKDLWHEELIGLLDHAQLYKLIKIGLTDEYNRSLLAKYLPRIRSKSNTFNDRHKALNQFAFGLLKVLDWKPAEYRKFKSSGSAHDFQRKMSAGEWDKLNFNSLPGRVLHQLVNNVGLDQQTTLQRRGIEEAYLEWIMEQPVAKFTGYVYELMQNVRINQSLASAYTTDKQFDGLIELAKKDRKITENVWCALDTSGSMSAKVANTTAMNICLSLGIYFSTLNEGAFKDHVIMFDSRSRVKKLTGTFTEKAMQLLSSETAWGNTNFQSVIDEIVNVRKTRPDVPVADYPTTLLVVSDMQFDPVGANTRTNYEEAMSQLASVGLPNMRIIWWHVTDRTDDFPNTIDDKGVVMIGGFDGAILSTLIGEKEVVNSGVAENNVDQQPTPYAAMLMALDQEILNLIV